MEMPSIALAFTEWRLRWTCRGPLPANPARFYKSHATGHSRYCKVMIRMRGALIGHTPSTRPLAQNLFTQMCSPIANRDGVGKLTACANLFTCLAFGVHSRRGAVMSGLGGRREPAVAREGVADVAVAGSW